MIDEPAITSEEILAGIRVQDMEELKETALVTDDGKHVRAVTWDLVREETSRDDHYAPSDSTDKFYVSVQQT